MHLIKSLRLDGFLSFAPGSAAVPLGPLNVLIGPNGSGKSNLMEALGLLATAPTAFAGAVRDGGGAWEWLWKGEGAATSAAIEVVLNAPAPMRDLRYRLAFTAAAYRTELTDEVLEEEEPRCAADADVFYYYRFQAGDPVIHVGAAPGGTVGKRQLTRHDLKPDESVLSQYRDPVFYAELKWVGERFSRIQSFREWHFGGGSPVRRPQATNLPSDGLLSDASNLALVLNQLEHAGVAAEFNRLLSQFLPRYQRFSTLIQGGLVQLYLHEHGLKAPIPVARLSDGTIRFMAILALLLSPNPPPLVCMEEPELGLHPDVMAMLAELLVEASARMQLVVATHSDDLVSSLTEHADSVLVCEHLGGSVLRRVESAKLRHWLEKYRLGEIWRMGALGGNP